MTRELKSFPSAVASLWLRLIGVAIFSLLFAEVLVLASGAVEGWSYYLTTPEVAFEVVVRLVFAALAGIALGTLLTVAGAPFLWHCDSFRERLADRVAKAATRVAVFLAGWFTVEILTGSFEILGRHPRRLEAAYLLAIAAALSFPRGRKNIATSLDGVLGEKTTRRAAIATGLGATALVAAEFAINRTIPAAAKAATVTHRIAKSNILLTTFDALSAEDMSLYGYVASRPRPHIDAFALKSTVFTSFFSSSTFSPLRASRAS